MNVVFHPEAYDEMLESARYFESCNSRVDPTNHEVPESGPVERAKIRKSLVHGFPFTILYEARQNEIFIAAVMHQRRKPGYWRHRLK
jgi:hypothetical protein